MQFTIQELRARKGFTQKKLAELMKVQPNSVREWERNPLIMRTENLVKLAKILEVTLNDIKLKL